MKTTLRGLLFLAALIVLAASTAQAAGITVDAGGSCTLADAITAANSDTATGGCPAGAGADTIILQADVTLASALPNIVTTVIIQGNGKTINGGAGDFSVLKIVAGGNLTLNNATVTGGKVLTANGNLSGGGIYAADTDTAVILNNCTVSGNTSDNMGGGIMASGQAEVTLNNSTVSGNTCRNGGGITIANAGTIVTLNNSTVSNNTATGFGGGGIYVLYGASVTLRSSIVSGNTALDGNEIYSGIGGCILTADSSNVFGYSGETSAQAFSGFTPGASDVVATSDGGAPAALSAILSSLADNGGPTQTHALPAGSPAIDMDATCDDGKLTADQRGYSRPAGTGCDAGSFEYGAILDTDKDGIADSTDNCPLVANANQTNTDGDTLGDVCDTDDDNDTVLDATDNCPLIANADQKNTDGDTLGDACDTVDDRADMTPIYKLLLKKRR